MIKYAAVFALLALLTLVAGACGDDEPGKLVILTNDSFDISKEVILEFEEANNAKVTIQKAGSSGAVPDSGHPGEGEPFWGCLLRHR